MRFDLHVHLDFNQYSLTHVLSAMDVNEITGIAGGKLDRDYYQRILETADNEALLEFNDAKGLRTKTGHYVFAFKEYSIDDFHFSSVGIELTNPSIDDLARASEKGNIITINHPYVSTSNPMKGISFEKDNKLRQIASKYDFFIGYNGYCNSELRKKIAKVYSLLGHQIGNADANHAALHIAEFYGKEVLPTTDLHASKKEALNNIGTAYIDFEPVSKEPEEIILQIKDNYSKVKQHRDTVSTAHIIKHFAPKALTKIYK